MKEKKNRVCSELQGGDEVKILRKRRPHEKERVENYSQNVYTTENIENKLGQNHYRVEGFERQHLRFEIGCRLPRRWYSYDFKIAIQTSGSGLGLVGSQGLAMLVKLWINAKRI